MKLNLEDCKLLLEKALKTGEIYNVELKDIGQNISRNFHKTYKEYSHNVIDDAYKDFLHKDEIYHIRMKYMTVKSPKELHKRYYNKKKYSNEYKYLKPWIDSNLHICELFENVKKNCEILKGRKVDPNKVDESKKYVYSKDAENFTRNIFSNISEPVYEYLKDMFYKEYARKCETFEESGYKNKSDFFKSLPRFLRNSYDTIISEFYDNKGNKVKNFKNKLEKKSDEKAKLVVKDYVNKNVDKIAYILDNKQLESYFVSELEYQTGAVKSDILFCFNDEDSFKFLTSIKYNTSKYGMDFIQYPSRFYDVVSKNKIDFASEEKMKTIFLEQNYNTLKI